MTWPHPVTRSALNAARQFDPLRARQTLETLCRHVRTMDTPAVQRGAETLLEALRGAGIADARIVDFPADGATEYGGWLAPVAWQVASARLALADDPAPPLADFAHAPQSLAPGSPSTPQGASVEGTVIALTADALLPATRAASGSRFAGRFILLPAGAATAGFNAFAAAHGALAVIATSPGPLADAIRFLNDAVPIAAGEACIPCFVLSPARAADLRQRLAAAPELRLRAQVCARRTIGTFPLVTGSVGAGAGAPVCIYAHLDEPGANDNASGCAVAVEALRVLQQLPADPARPQHRPIHFFFSLELRGMQAWINRQPRPTYYVSGLNLDMVGADPAREPCSLRIGGGLPHRPHFGRRVLDEALRLADCVTPCPSERKSGPCVLGDSAVIGSHEFGGAVSIEQTTGPSYHTDADTPARLIGTPMLHWTGAAATAWLHILSRLDNADLAHLAGTVRDEALQALAAGNPAAATEARRAAVELAALKRAALPVPLFTGWSRAADFYAAGVSRRTGRWPALAALERIDACATVVDEARRRIPDSSGRASAPGTDTFWRREADKLVPVACFRGPLCFEDQWRPEARRALAERVGLDVGWGTEAWAWRLCTCFRGRQTLTEIVDDLAGLGVGVDGARAVRLARLLVDLGKVRLRPAIDADTLRHAVASLGVRRGSILMVHAGLSRCGYLRGGAAMVVETLRDLLGPEGTLVMPTHTVSVLGTAPFDPRVSPSLVGAVSEHFRRLPGVIRSAHPTHSVAAWGPAAETLTRGHRAAQAPLDRRGFWGRLYDLQGDVLLLCPIRSCTIFHVGENWAGVPLGPLFVHAATRSGGRRTTCMPKAPWHVDHFESTMAAPLLASGVMRQAQLGEAPIYFGPARAMADISCEVNRRNPACSLGQEGRCTCFYCHALRRNLAAAGISAAAPANPA